MTASPAPLAPFVVTLRHDAGLVALHVHATDRDAAVGIAVGVEGAPRSACVIVETLDEYDRRSAALEAERVREATRRERAIAALARRGLSLEGIAAAATRSYLETFLWASADYCNVLCECHADDPDNACDFGMLSDSYDIDDVDASARAEIAAEIERVLVEHPLAAALYFAREGVEQFGHDLYLTREHHGAGFWDRGLGDLGEVWSTIAHDLGEAGDLIDDGSGVLSL